MNPHGDKYPVHFQFPLFSRYHVADTDFLHLVFPQNLIHYRIPENFHIGKVFHPLLKHFCRPKFIPAVNQIYLLAGSGQENSVLHRHISAPYHCHHTVSKKSPVACSTIRNPHSSQFLFTGHPQFSMHCPGSRQYCFCPIFSFVRHNTEAFPCSAITGGNQFRSIFLIPVPILNPLHARYFRFQEFHPHAVRMLPEFHPQIISINPRHPQIIIHFISGEYLPSAHRAFFHHQCIQPSPFGIYRR